MLVCSANWLLSDGSLTLPPSARDLTAFLRSLHILAGRAGFRSDGRYQPIARVDLVLAGDMLDTLSSTRWSGRTRPWHATPTAYQRHTSIAAACFQRSQRSLAVLRRLHRDGIRVPAATHLQRLSATETCRVPVQIVALGGDYDLPWPTAPTDRHAPQFSWSPAISSRWGDEGEVWITHGHRGDPTAALPTPGEPRGPSVRESLAVDLVARFLQRLSQLLPGGGVRRLGRHLAGVHPLALPQHLAGWLNRGGLKGTDLKSVQQSWLRAVSQWHRTTRREAPIVQDLDIDICDRLAGWLDSYRPGDIPSAAATDLAAVLQPDAFTAAVDGLPTGVKTVVLGHLCSAPSREPVMQERPGRLRVVSEEAVAADVLGLVPAEAARLNRELAWSAVFEQGEHQGLRCAQSAQLGPHENRSFAAEVVASPTTADGVIDAMQVA